MNYELGTRNDEDYGEQTPGDGPNFKLLPVEAQAKAGRTSNS